MENESNEPMEADSSSSDDEGEQLLLQKAEELEAQLSDNKYLYDVHLELVDIYLKLSDLKSLKLAYERFHKYFPLTPEIWLTWINAEKQIASSESEIKNVFGLFDKAVEDYLSVDLWIEYAQYSIGASDLQTTRSILEKGLQAAGLHCSNGSLLWDTLRELELAHLSLAAPDSPQYKDQITKITEVFRRQLSVPLTSMTGTYLEWQAWLQQLPPDHKIDKDPVEWGYKKALKQLEAYAPFEAKLLATTEETAVLHIYREYIKALSDPSTILCVYERAVAQLCLNTDIWQEYCRYALKLGELADKISKRALRNCPWSEALWVARLRILESLGREEKEVLGCFEQGVASLGGGAQGAELWLAYLEFVRRNGGEAGKLTKLFEQAIGQLRHNPKITRWYAKTLAKANDMAGARKAWKNLLKDPQNKITAKLWLDFAHLERQHGEAPLLRGLFQRALTSVTDYPQCISDEWQMFEHEEGTLNDVLKCEEKCSEAALKHPQPAKATPREATPTTTTTKKRRRSDDTDNAHKKNKSDAPKPPQAKKIPIVRDPKITIFISNLYPSINEKRLKKVFPNAVNIELVVDRLGKSRCYGYAQFTMEEEVAHALARDRELLDDRPIFISPCKPDRAERRSAFKYSGEVEANKLFVKGLPVDKRQEDVEALFKPHGAIGVRLVLHKSGQPKGLAYVEFADDTTAKKALESTNQMKIGEHTITVAISAPPVKTPVRVEAAAPTRYSRSRLQVPLIPRSLQGKAEAGEKNGGEQAAPKSNDDFRKMLLK